jgi:predicted SAM-dependent methyltransferase
VIALKKILRESFDHVYLTIYRTPRPDRIERLRSFDRIQYGCGSNFLAGWLNVDMVPEFRVPLEHRPHYLQMSLIHRHPFANDTFRFEYAEDVLEHLSQDASLLFVAEAYRTLQSGGTLRLSFPGLRGVLRRHYRSSDFAGADAGRKEAYTPFGHKHFYCEESIELVGRHLGFRQIDFPGHKESRHPELAGLETRVEQSELNLNVELTK